MPGYPLVLVTTDLLQEGEDLHLFCSRVHHYGISWMPSSMEQRIGRIDRVRSQTERRLMQVDTVPKGDELLQVFIPNTRAHDGARLASTFLMAERDMTPDERERFEHDILRDEGKSKDEGGPASEPEVGEEQQKPDRSVPLPPNPD